MIQIISKIFFGLTFLIAGFILTDRGCSSPSDNEIENQGRLCNNSSKTIGHYDSTYSEFDVKVFRGSGSHIYSLKYSYQVNGNKFEDSVSRKDLPKKLNIDIWYDPTDPIHHSTVNPCNQFDYDKAHKYPAWFMWLGIPLLLIGIGSINSLYKSSIRNIAKALK